MGFDSLRYLLDLIIDGLEIYLLTQYIENMFICYVRPKMCS